MKKILLAAICMIIAVSAFAYSPATTSNSAMTYSTVTPTMVYHSNFYHHHHHHGHHHRR